jgi:hypothetical protein
VPAAIRCFVEAVHARHPAQLKETRPTVEGDPIPITYIAGADGRVEVITDSRPDTFGSGIIERRPYHQASISADRPAFLADGHVLAEPLATELANIAVVRFRKPSVSGQSSDDPGSTKMPR